MDISGTLELVLSLEGYSVRTAFHGKDALERLKVAPLPDLIISDVMMPTMNAYDFVTALRDVPAYANIPLILVSAAQLDEKRLKPGSWDLFFTKPFNLDKLLIKISEMIARGRKQTES